MKRLLALLACVAVLLPLGAVPAHPQPITMSQPDGSSLTIALVGDEFYHYHTTADGYTIVRENGGWEYARVEGSHLAPTGVLAHNAGHRTASEQSLLASLGRHVTDRSQATAGRQARAARDKQIQRPNREPVVDYSKFRGLIVLVNFTDKKFRMSNATEFYHSMLNTKNFEGYNNDETQTFTPCTGSMRDYYYDQSMGQFDPKFDVAGPVEVPFSCMDGRSRARDIFQAAMDAIDPVIDFTRYDSNSDGLIDMVFFIVAGHTSNYVGNDESYLWPHMSYLYGYNSKENYYYYLVYDGMYMSRYASSGEIYGWESEGMVSPDGIGTMCHEFSHVLGLPDLYDTDYEGSGGQSNVPGKWDVMSGGSYGNQGRTPVGFSLWERHQLGWATPTDFNTAGHYELDDLAVSNQGLLMQSPVEGEMFYFENRQNNKWDSELPGHGLLVTRVDYTNTEVWNNNDVNVDPVHNYYELVRSGETAEETAFPGPLGVTDLSPFTTPALVTWDGSPCDYALSDIQETEGRITFDATILSLRRDNVEDFETMPTMTNNMATDVAGHFAQWDFYKAKVDNETHFGSSHECVMGMPSTITMSSDVEGHIFEVSVDAYNSSLRRSQLQLQYSTDQGTTWVDMGAQTVSASAKVTLTWRTALKDTVRFRLTRSAGTSISSLFVDNFTISSYGELNTGHPDALLGDVNGDGRIDVDDVNLIINILLDRDSADNYSNRAYITGGNTVSVDDLNALINILIKQ